MPDVVVAALMSSFCSFCVSLAYSTPGATAPNRFVGIGSRDNNFLNIPQQTQVGLWDMLELTVKKKEKEKETGLF